MTNDFTPSEADSGLVARKPPQSSLNFLRQFARAYFYFDSSEFSPIVIN